MSVVGASIWSSSNDIFTLTSTYDFHWFLSITSFILSISFYCIHTFNFILDYFRIIGNINLIYIHIPTITLLCVIYAIFWISTSIYLSYTVAQCNYYEFSCTGEIISMIFGYLNFFIWSVIFYIGFSKWVYRYQNPVNHNQIHLKDKTDRCPFSMGIFLWKRYDSRRYFKVFGWGVLWVSRSTLIFIIKKKQLEKSNTQTKNFFLTKRVKNILRRIKVFYYIYAFRWSIEIYQ